MNLLIVLPLITLVICGCDVQQREENNNRLIENYEFMVQEDRAASKNCTDAGGIPIRSDWDSAIIDCKLIKRCP